MPSSGVQTCALDRKSTRLNSSHTIISYAVFCLEKKNTADRLNCIERLAGNGLRPQNGELPARIDPPTVRAPQITPLPTHTTLLFCFFFNDRATTEISPLPPTNALPI